MNLVRVVVASVALSLVGAPARAQNAGACVRLEPNLFRRVTPNDSLIGFVDAPDVVRYRGEWWLLGPAFWSALRIDGRDSVGRIEQLFDGMRLADDGTLHPVPWLPRFGDFARAIAHRDTLHVLWGGRGTLAHDSIFATQWADSGWRLPAIIATGGEWLWARAHQTGPTERGDTLFLALPGRADSMHVSLFRRIRGAWTESRMLPSSFVAYVTLAVRGDELIMAAIGGPFVNSGRRSSRGQVIVLSSRDGGESWGRPEVVYESADRHPYEPRLSVSGSTVRLVWSTGSPESSNADSVLIAVRVDGRWSGGAGVGVPEEFGNMTASDDGRGGVFVALPMMSGSRLLRWRDGHWCNVSIPGRRVLPNPAFMPVDGDAIRLIWGEVRQTPSSADFSSHTALVSTGSCC